MARCESNDGKFAGYDETTVEVDSEDVAHGSYRGHAPLTTTAIYTLSDPRDGRVRYVGKTVNPPRRLVMHINHARSKYKGHHCACWIRGLLAIGLRPQMDVIETCGDDWAERERFHIAYFRAEGADLTNITAGGEGIDIPHTAEWHANIGAAKRGKPLAASTLAKLSAFNRALHDAGCKRGHTWTAENTRIDPRRGYRVCRQCFREYQEQARRARGVPARADYVPALAERCLRGHALDGENLRLLARRDRTERICRACVRLRNKATKARRRQRIKESNRGG